MVYQAPEWDKAGFYQVEGGKYPSVTTVLKVIDKPALMFWYARIQRETDAAIARKLPTGKAASVAILKNTRPTEEVSGAAIAVGNQAHAMVEWTIKKLLSEKVGSKPETGKEAAVCFASWEVWWKASGLKPVSSETLVWSDKHHYAGTADCIAKKDGKLYVLDWKSSKGIYPEMYLQLVAYRYALIEQGRNVVGSAIVRLPKEGGAVEVKMLPKALTLDPFLAALALWKWKRLSEGKDIGDA